MCRGTVLALLAAYLHYLSLAFIGLMILTNLGLASCLLRTDGSKHLWTACAGVLLPNAFISRDTVEIIGRQKTRELFRRFYKVNSLVFLLVMGVGALVTCLCLITLTDFIQFNCNNLPFLSYDPVKVCLKILMLKSKLIILIYINVFSNLFIFRTALLRAS